MHEPRPYLKNYIEQCHNATNMLLSMHLVQPVNFHHPKTTLGLPSCSITFFCLFNNIQQALSTIDWRSLKYFTPVINQRPSFYATMRMGAPSAAIAGMHQCCWAKKAGVAEHACEARKVAGQNSILGLTAREEARNRGTPGRDAYDAQRRARAQERDQRAQDQDSARQEAKRAAKTRQSICPRLRQGRCYLGAVCTRSHGDLEPGTILCAALCTDPRGQPLYHYAADGKPWQCPKASGGECPYLHETAAPSAADDAMGGGSRSPYDEEQHGY